MAKPTAPKRALAERIADADALATRWFSNGNEAEESGNHEKAEACYAKSQYWLDRLNLFTNQACRSPPIL